MALLKVIIQSSPIVVSISGVGNSFCMRAKFRSQPNRRATWLYTYLILL